ncbi:MAG: hypothetical protein AB7O96_18135 [Pseudobdellovibrionaceae bacterium]
MKLTLTKTLMILMSLTFVACSNPTFEKIAQPLIEAPDDQVLDNPEPIPEEQPPQEETPVDEEQDIVTCEPGQVEVVVPTKILFVVDQSGSNATGTGSNTPPTDLEKAFRLKVIQDFHTQHAGKDHLSWGFITFNSYSGVSTINALINTGDSITPSFSRDPASVTTALESFKGIADTGRTPYKAALQSVETLIAADMAASTVESEYLIAFITDGVPSDYCPNSPSQWLCPGSIQDPALDADIQRLVDLAPSRIQFGTVYYGPADTGASGRLARMAQMGGGQFVDANTTSSIQLNDVITVPKPICQ